MIQFKQIAVEDAQLKFADGDNSKGFTGYASVFGGNDSYGDTIHPGAYSKSVGDGAEVKMYFNHGWVRHELPIGKMYVKQDDIGLYVEHAEFTSGIKMADDVALAVKHKTVNGLSIGYRMAETGFKKKSQGKGRDIYEIDFLKEVSVVDWPADRSASIMDVKSAIEEAESLKEIERLLRDAAGFSRSDAVALVSRIKSLDHGDRAPKVSAAEIAGIFQQFKLPQS